jgi:hypothetical protein
VTPHNQFDIPEVLKSHVIPSVEVRIVPKLPTVIKVLLPYVNPQRVFDVPEALEVHVVPSADVRIVPEEPTITKALFP